MTENFVNWRKQTAFACVTTYTRISRKVLETPRFFAIRSALPCDVDAMNKTRLYPATK